MTTVALTVTCAVTNIYNCAHHNYTTALTVTTRIYDNAQCGYIHTIALTLPIYSFNSAHRAYIFNTHSARIQHHSRDYMQQNLLWLHVLYTVALPVTTHIQHSPWRYTSSPWLYTTVPTMTSVPWLNNSGSAHCEYIQQHSSCLHVYTTGLTVTTVALTVTTHVYNCAHHDYIQLAHRNYYIQLRSPWALFSVPGPYMQSDSPAYVHRQD